MPSYNLSGESIAGPGGGGMGCAGNPNDDCSCGSCICTAGCFAGILAIIIHFS